MTSAPADPAPERDEKGRFLPGNRFWEARSRAGPKPKFATAEELWAACTDYFAWVEDNPLWEDRLVSFQGQTKHVPVAKMRAMTIGGLCLFLDITRETWCEWRVSRPDLSEVMARAEAIIYTQKFTGAAADLLNANIIARDLGLVEKSELTGKDGAPILPEPQPRDIARAVLDVIRTAGVVEAEPEPAPAPEPSLPGGFSWDQPIARPDRPAAPPAVPAPPPRPRRSSLEPGEREVVASGAWITYDDQLAKYAIHDAAGRLHGYRRSLEAARQFAESIKSRPPQQEQPE